MMTLKAIKESSLDNFDLVDPEKRGRLLRDHYAALISKAMQGGEITVKFHGVYNWSFSSPCHLRFYPSGRVSLISYYTDVADFYPNNEGAAFGAFDGVLFINGWYSVTTSKHIDEFRSVLGRDGNAISVTPNCWDSAAGTGYDLDNFVELGLAGLLSDMSKTGGVYKYQKLQMAQLLQNLFYDVLGGDFGSYGIGETPGGIMRKLYNDMTKDNKRIYTGGGLESWTFANDSKNIRKSWDELKTILGKRLGFNIKAVK